VVIWVIGKIEENICNLTIRHPTYPSGFLSLALEARGGVTNIEGMKQGHCSRCIRTKKCTDGINTYKLEVLSHTPIPNLSRHLQRDVKITIR